MTQIKAIASDLDGTLFNDEAQLSEKTKQVINDCLKKNILFVPCTARTMSLVDDWLLKHDEIKYIVSSNGAIIYDKQKKKIVSRNTISAENAILLLDELSLINPYWTIDANDQLYSSQQILDDKEDNQFDEDFINHLLKTRTFIREYSTLLSDSNHDVRKIHFITNTPSCKEKTIECLKQFDFIRITSSHELNLEITHPLATKGNAFSTILQHENINPTLAVAFGDNDNDIDLLGSVGLGCAMANSTSGLQKVAHVIIGSNNEDGVACFLQENII